MVLERSDQNPDTLSKEGRDILEAMAEGKTCYYFYSEGGVGLYGEDGKPTTPRIDIATFLDLRSRGLIDKRDSVGQGDLRFATNTKADIYTITEQGRNTLEAKA